MGLKHHWCSANEIDFVAVVAVTIVVDVEQEVQSDTNSFEYTSKRRKTIIKSLINIILPHTSLQYEFKGKCYLSYLRHAFDDCYGDIEHSEQMLDESFLVVSLVYTLW